MKKTILLSTVALILPLYGFIALMSSYLPRVYYASIFMHTILIAVVCSTALSICYFFYMHYVDTKYLLFFVIMLFCEILGITFFLHAIAVPSFYLLDKHIFDITEHYGLLFSSGALLLLFIKSYIPEDFLYVRRRAILLYVALALFGWFITLMFIPTLSEMFSLYVDHAIFFSGVFLVAGIYALMKERAILRCYALFPYLVAGLSLLVNVTIIPFFYKEWNMVWWYFHIVILCAETVIFIGILKKCDKKCAI